MSEKVANLSTDTFNATVTRSATPILVDFWAPWCGPCKAMSPILDELAGELDGRLTIAKVNVDENDALAAEYGIKSIPTMLLFKGGQIVEHIGGRVSKAELKDRVLARI